MQPEKKQKEYRKTGIDRVVASRGSHKDSKTPANALPQHRSCQAADQGGTQLYTGIRNENIKKAECAPEREIRYEFQQGQDHGSEWLEQNHSLDKGIALERGSDRERREHQHRADQNDAQIVA